MNTKQRSNISNGGSLRSRLSPAGRTGKLKTWAVILPLLVLMFSAVHAYAQSPPAQTNYAKNLPGSDTRAKNDAAIRACAAAADELQASRRLIGLLESENVLLRERVETAQVATTVLAELDAARKTENDALRLAIDAKNETIAAKNTAIDSQNKLIDALKKKKTSPLARLGGILIGAAAVAILK